MSWGVVKLVTSNNVTIPCYQLELQNSLPLSEIENQAEDGKILYTMMSEPLGSEVCFLFGSHMEPFIELLC